MGAECKYHVREVLLAAASTMAISALAVTTAAAQSTPPATSSASKAQADAPTEVAATLTEEIVVTARRRHETAQTTPLSVSSISAESLAERGIDTPTEIAQVVPGLNMVASGVFSQPVVRGISSTSTNPGDEANVSIYVDGVYYSQMSSNFFNFNNIDRVEVLKGPQGTLFGRNATGGAITIITRAPSYTPTGSFSAGVGNLDSTDASAYFSSGITNNVAFDVALLHHENDGYVHDLIRGGMVGGEEFNAARAKLLFEPTDRAKITLAADVSRADNTSTVSSQAYEGNTRGRRVNPATPLPTGPYQYLLTRPPENTVDTWGASLRAEFDLGFANLLSITAYRDDRSESVTDTDGSQLDLAGAIATIPAQTWTQEIQLNSPGSARVQWVVGLFGLDGTAAFDPLIAFPSLATRRTFVDTRAYAAFGELTYPFTDRLSATAGLRFSHERKENYGQAGASAPVRFEADWESWTPRAIVQYQWPDTLNLYASYSRGFKSGQFNSTTLSGTPVDPETIDAYEIGAKTLLSSRWRASAAVYSYEYKDIQVSSRPPSTVLPELNNAASARIRGFELSVETLLADALTLSLGVSLIHGEYTSFPNAVVTIPSTAVDPAPATACISGTGPLLGGNRSLVCDVSGSQLIRTPEWTVNLGLNYVRPLAAGELDASLNVFVSDNFYFDPLNRLEQASYTVVNSNLGWTLPDGRTRIGIWGDNLTDEVYALVLTTSANADWVNYAKPRTYGVKASYKF